VASTEIQLRINSKDDNKTISMLTTDTFYDLKEEIEKTTGIPISEQMIKVDLNVKLFMHEPFLKYFYSFYINFTDLFI